MNCATRSPRAAVAARVRSQCGILSRGENDARVVPGTLAREERRHRVKESAWQRNAVSLSPVRRDRIQAGALQILRIHVPEYQEPAVAGPLGYAVDGFCRRQIMFLAGS